jgi:rhodanese-related sulfurtransferase
VTELKDAVDKGAVVIVDTRYPESYEQEHIKGAINIMEANLDAHVSALPRDKMIVAYCSCPTEQTSAGLARKLKAKGFNNTAALVGGTDAWKRAGLPMEKGPSK